MNVGSLFSGIGGIDLGLERAGHRVVFQCEKDEYRRRVLARHWPGVRCWEDVVHLRESAERSAANRVRPSANGRGREAGPGLPSGVDLLCGGFPCQDLSVAGRRAGLAGERSSLFFEFARVADALLPDGGWVLIENVPGLLSSNGGRDFAVLLATLAELGFHDSAWRVLDSRYLGVPQRRRRVFVFARRSRGRSASEVLLEPESGGGDFEAGREVGQRIAAPLTKGSAATRGVSYPGRRKEDDENLAITGPLGGGDNGVGRRTIDDPNLVAGTVRSHARPGSNEVGSIVGSSPHSNGMRTASRLSRGVDCRIDPKPDGPRYAACGDAVTVNVAHWIGERLMAYEMAAQASQKEVA